MKAMLRILVVFLTATFCIAFTPDDNNKAAIKYTFVTTFGCLDTAATFLSKKSFDSLITFPLCARDSNKSQFQVQSFDITYAERGLYQDSTGLPIIFTDYTNVPCKGNTVPGQWVNLFKERAYKGDTVYIENIKILGSDNKSHQSKGIKMVIQ